MVVFGLQHPHWIIIAHLFVTLTVQHRIISIKYLQNIRYMESIQLFTRNYSNKIIAFKWNLSLSQTVSFNFMDWLFNFSYEIFFNPVKSCSDPWRITFNGTIFADWSHDSMHYHYSKHYYVIHIINTIPSHYSHYSQHVRVTNGCLKYKEIRKLQRRPRLTD